MEGPVFLKQRYDLHNSPEVDQAARRTHTRTEEVIPQDPRARIQNYLDRFAEIIDREDPTRRAHGIEAVKRVLHSGYVIKSEDVPESAFLLEQRIARDLGYGDVEITDEFREQKTQQIISNQVQSLDKWVDYFSSDDADYPDWSKYWALRSVLEMGRLEKQIDNTGAESASFTRRTKDTVASFPPLNPRALAMTITAVQQRLSYDRMLEEQRRLPKDKRQKIPVTNLSTQLSDEAFTQLAGTRNFSRLYAQFLIEIPEYSTEGLQETRGKWVTYHQGSNAEPLVDSLDGYPLEWCTAGIDTAKSQLEAGDFHVYYSLNEQGAAVIPRIAIRMEGNKIAEVRGNAPEQNLDPYIAPVVDEKMAEFGTEGEKYKKRAHDMKLLTEIEHRSKIGQPLSKDDLTFLYEINGSIDGFGYGDDPRIEEVRSQRVLEEDFTVVYPLLAALKEKTARGAFCNQEELTSLWEQNNGPFADIIGELRTKRDVEKDMPIIFGCEPQQIAHNSTEIFSDTKAYVGPLFPGVFDRIRHVEHIYTAFPEGEMARETLEVGRRTAAQLEQALKEQDVQISGYAQRMLHSGEFATLKSPEDVDLVTLKVGDLGFTKTVTTQELYACLKEFGLELVPPEVGPEYRLAHMDQPANNWVYMGMKPISDSGSPLVLSVAHDLGKRWLYDSWAEPDYPWNTRPTFVFRLRKLET